MRGKLVGIFSHHFFYIIKLFEDYYYYGGSKAWNGKAHLCVLWVVRVIPTINHNNSPSILTNQLLSLQVAIITTLWLLFVLLQPWKIYYKLTVLLPSFPNATSTRKIYINKLQVEQRNEKDFGICIFWS